MLKKTIVLRQLGINDYQIVHEAMRQFTKKRTYETQDELWLTEHYPVFTQGKTGRKEHILNSGDIPVIQSDRGGQVTYHGPGQQIMYVLLDLKRNQLNIKKLVTILEKTVINTLLEFYISSYTQDKAPGVYIKQKKICSIGLCIYKSYSFHGLALNVNMDLTPFRRINPCGYAGMQMTQINDFIPNCQIKYVKYLLVKHFCSILNLQIVK